MEEYKTLDKETVLAELRFAIEHKIKFSKKDLKEILSSGDVQDICNELNINAKIRSIFVDGPIRDAYHTLEFYHFYGSVTQTIGKYTEHILVSSNDEECFQPIDNAEHDVKISTNEEEVQHNA